MLPFFGAHELSRRLRAWALVASDSETHCLSGCDLRRYENNPHGWRFIEVSPLPNLRRDGQDHIGTAFPRLLLEPVFARQGDEA